MIDSAGKPPSGIMDGNFQWLGSYEQCKSVSFENHFTDFKGEYCRARVLLVRKRHFVFCFLFFVFCFLFFVFCFEVSCFNTQGWWEFLSHCGLTFSWPICSWGPQRHRTNLRLVFEAPYLKSWSCFRIWMQGIPPRVQKTFFDWILAWQPVMQGCMTRQIPFVFFSYMYLFFRFSLLECAFLILAMKQMLRLFSMTVRVLHTTVLLQKLSWIPP